MVGVLVKSAVVVTWASAAVACGPDHSDGETSDPGPYLPIATTQVPSEDGSADQGGSDAGGSCPADLPSRDAMVTRSGAEVAGLFTCTSVGVAKTVVQNTSTDVVWFLSAPESPYWDPSDDASRSIKVQVFRMGIRRVFAQQNLVPWLTLEPGTSVQLPTYASQVHLSQSVQEQAAWQTVSASVDAATKKAKAVARRLVVNGSPTRNALITCVEQGYAAGKSLDAMGSEPADQLETALGLRGQYGTCAQAIDDAAEAEKRKSGAAVTLTGEDLATTMKEPTLERRGSVLLEDAARAFRVLAHP